MIPVKIYGSNGWIITSKEGELMGFIWKPESSNSFRYETFGLYSEIGFGDSLKECLTSVETAKR